MVDNENMYANYDAETMEMLKAAREFTASMHGQGELTTEPSVFMAEQNKALEKAAAELQTKRENGQAQGGKKPTNRRKRPMVRQGASKPTAVPEQVPAAPQAVPEAPVSLNLQQPPEMHMTIDTQKQGPAVQMQPEPKQAVAQVKEEVPVQQEPVPEPPVVRQVEVPLPEQAMDKVIEFDAHSPITGMPSQGMFYDNKVFGQSMKLIDMMLLQNITFENYVDTFDEILNRRIRGVSAGDILVCDEHFMLQWLRFASFPKVGIPSEGFDCRKCGFSMHESTYTVNFMNMEFVADFDPVKIREKMPDGYYQFFMPDGREVNVYPRRRRHDAELWEWTVRYIRKFGKEPNKGHLEAVSTASIVEIEGCKGFDEKLNFIQEMDYEASPVFYDEVNSCSMISSCHVIHTCPKCGEKADYEYPFRLQDYIPKVHSRRDDQG